MLDGRYSGYSLGDLQEWVSARADSSGRVDLVFTRLPDVLQDAWLPDPAYARVPMDCYPLGGCSGVIDNDGHITLDYRAQLYNQKGGEGKLGRRLDTRTGCVNHAWFWLPDEEWGAGHGKRLMRRSTELYILLGLNSVSITAVAVGKYLWRMCGFQTTDPDEHSKTLDSIQSFFYDLGDHEVLPRFANLWEVENLDYNDAGEEVLVSAAQIAAAFAAAGRSFAIADLPEPTTPLIALSKALLLYNATQLWPGVLRLERGSLQLERLNDYTR